MLGVPGHIGGFRNFTVSAEPPTPKGWEGAGGCEEYSAALIDLNAPSSAFCAVVVACGSYKETPPNPKDFDEDALAMAAALKALKYDKVILVSGADATRERVLQALTEAAKYCAEDSTFTFYYTGHGAVNPESKEFEFCTKEGNLTAGEFAAAIEQIKSPRKCMLIDACYAGAMGTSKGVPASAAAAATPLSTDALDAIAQHSGAVLLASSTSKQTSTRDPGSEISQFTAAVLRSISLDDVNYVANLSGLIYPAYMWVSVAEQLAALGKQTPIFKTAGELELWSFAPEPEDE
jgi:hypothetical protein